MLQLPQALVQAHLNAAVALDGRQLCPRGLLTLRCSQNINALCLSGLLTLERSPNINLEEEK